MAPLTLAKKYDDLVLVANQPLSAYKNLLNKDLDDIINKKWPFIIHSITYTPRPFEISASNMSIATPMGEIHTNLERNLKIQHRLYSDVAEQHHQRFFERFPMKRLKYYINEEYSYSIQTTSTFSPDLISNVNIPEFFVFHRPKSPFINSIRQDKQNDFDHLRKYLTTTLQKSPHSMLILKQALKECCHYGNYSLLYSLCVIANISIDNILFDNHDTVLHESIKFNNRQLVIELLRHKFNVNISGKLGTPLVTAIHYNIVWAVEILLNHDADLTKRHIDWPYLTLYQYCIQFSRIDIKLLINKYIRKLVQNRKDGTIRKLIKSGWIIDKDKQ